MAAESEVRWDYSHITQCPHVTCFFVV